MTYKTSLKHQKKLFSWCDAVLFAPGRYLENEVVESAKNCKIFQLWSSGFDKFNVKAAKKITLQFVIMVLKIIFQWQNMQ